MREGKYDNFGGKDKEKSKQKEQIKKLEKDVTNKE